MWRLQLVVTVSFGTALIGSLLLVSQLLIVINNG